MVLRKQTPHPGGLVPAPLAQAANNPPYPSTPADEQVPQLPLNPPPSDLYSPDLNKSPAFNLKPLDDAQKKEQDDESDYSEDWDKSDDEDRAPQDIPQSLKVGGGKSMPSKNALPDALRVGPPPGTIIRKSTEALVPEPTGASAGSLSSNSSIPLQTNNPNNPYLRMQTTGQSNYGGESSAQIWGDMPSTAQKYGEVAELPAAQSPIVPTGSVSQLNINSNVPPAPNLFSPDQPPLIAVESATPSTAHPRQDSTASSAFNAGVDISSFDAQARGHGLPSDSNVEDQVHRTWQQQKEWERSERERKRQELEAAAQAAQRAEQERKHEEEWHIGEQTAQFLEDEFPPTLPPRRSHEESAPPQPLRPAETGVIRDSDATAANAAIKQQTKEFYKIKHIRWHDGKQNGIRTSPILTQNANGPCPLLALVNALVLSTPANEQTALVETLRTREQVSLGLLLDAVFDELMSGRRGGAAQELPDVGELYTFLVTLHTGMNVNPMYVQDPTATDGPSALIPSLATRPGGFENTREMRLYKTFNIPLMHGWLPEAGSEAYIAFERVAKTYEDSQHVQFQEEELERKLQNEGLSSDEQTLFTDLIAIKEFLTQWPTQLTTFGLKTIQQSVQPGQIGILFRNDHFSTLYKHPRSGQILTLVTDAGYSSHDEIVWESLVDVNGQGSELYSGDFRPVGNNANTQRPQSPQPIRSLLDVGDDHGWTTVQSRRNNQASQSTPALVGPNNPSSPISKTEQEDHDLALALQLQEEEEDRHRRSLEERRRRENTLSENMISSQSHAQPQNLRTPRPGESQNPPLIPPRRSNLPVHRPSEDAAPPPTYEEASTARPFHPPQGHPTNPNAPIAPQGSAYAINSANPLPLPPRPGRRPMGGGRIGLEQFAGQRPGRRHSSGVVQQQEKEKCIVM